ncbi:sensor histidine kinase [Umezawaea endophytica]|uniref:histidine kinase n=1 Tax=Umezawaea endophytica TaxID=1654476 RepID=A0A9X3AFZ7_9PSEU|nr:histidine kinase [Umezawaea endophytica]MCS7479402.1 histidine kinase [Umezawaea endophytica]
MRFTQTGRDAVVAAVLAVLGLLRLPLALLLNDGVFPQPGWVIACATAASTADVATLALRRRAPRTALALATAVVLAATALPAAFLPTGIGVPVCAYTAATLLPRRTTLITLSAGAFAHAAGGIASVALGGTVHTVVTFWANDGSDPVDLVLASVGSFAVPGLVGLYVRTTRAYTAELAAKVRHLEVERELRAEAAAAEERVRIARELHDIAAHDLSAIVVQAGAADRLVERDPVAARAALLGIREQGRRTLIALRGLVGIMRAAEDRPVLARVTDLVDSARDTGMDVSLTVEGDDRTVAPATGVAAYRLVQEALTNARQHARGAPVVVDVEYRAAHVRVAVRNGAGRPGPGPGGGHGVLGMGERVRHTGGDLTVGPTPDGGWLVDARFPRGSDVTAGAS